MRSPRPHRWPTRVLRALAWGTLLGLLGITAVVLGLRFVDPPTSAFVLREHISARARGIPPPTPLRWVPWAAIPPTVALAAVAAEDQRFPEHAGFDLVALRAVIEAQLGEGADRPRGASTISQQVAKNLFLWRERSWLRKALEAGLTVLIEALWPKRRILEVYLNVAQFGDGLYGIGAAAPHFFGKPASALGAAEGALMAAVLPNPVRLRIEAPSDHVRKRVRWIRRQMRQLGGVGYLEDL